MSEVGSSSPPSSPASSPPPLPSPPHAHSPPPTSIPAEPRLRLPVGFRFSLCDWRMVYFLSRKLLGLSVTCVFKIRDVDVSLFEPDQQPRNKQLHRQDASYFFTTRTHEEADGAGPSHPTPNGCWKRCGKVRGITHRARVVGYKKMFVYHQGKPPNEVQTFWIMKQVRLNPQSKQHQNLDPQKVR